MIEGLYFGCYLLVLILVVWLCIVCIIIRLDWFLCNKWDYYGDFGKYLKVVFFIS